MSMEGLNLKITVDTLHSVKIIQEEVRDVKRLLQLQLANLEKPLAADVNVDAAQKIKNEKNGRKLFCILFAQILVLTMPVTLPPRWKLALQT